MCKMLLRDDKIRAIVILAFVAFGGFVLAVWAGVAVHFIVKFW